MATHLSIEEIIAAASRLTPEERARLLRALAPKSSGGRRRITELRGLGKEIWQGVDAQEYINAERNSWES